ncbi:MAG: glycosyltransferase family 39 protein [Caldilineaceae bacterium]|nr:glycosyltransferase family 39 protein [Caldilineaceae bacterium]
MEETRSLRRTYPGGLRLAALAGILTGFALRLHHLGAESLWYDETVSAYLSRLAPGALIAHTAGDIHPPGYYLLLHAWRLLAQPTLHTGLEFGLAWPSVLWGMLIVALVGAIGRKLFDGRVGVMALWFAAVNPFHVWYSQEVRMYTQGAALALLCLWFLLRWRDDPRRSAPLLGYVLAAAAGLYTLYYFAFALIALAVISLIALARMPRGPRRRGAFVRWLLAQTGVLLLYAPWLPILWRQATDPPVPPWRPPWSSLHEVIQPINESLAALVTGQSPPLERLWPWAVVALLLALMAVLLPAQRGARDRVRGAVALLLYVTIPLALILLATLLGTPLYHVRYGFVYAPAFAVLAAVAVDELLRRRVWLGVGAGVALLLIGLAGDAAFWTNPRYRADDHRGAVAALAHQWRPGDVILVNAGWAYTALDTYWPQQPADPLASAPPPIALRQRLTDYASQLDAGRLPATGDEPGVIVLTTGSVDGPASLGWGDPASDFYAMRRAETIAALDAVSARHPRLWHYRIYDTVSDPDGVIRAWLDEQTVQLADVAYPGRDFLRTQLFATAAPLPDLSTQSQDNVAVGDALTLQAHSPLTSTEAGRPLYTTLFWQTAADAPPLPDLRMSLRLYGADGTLFAQADAPPSPPAPTWPAATVVRQPLAVDVPAALPPGEYTVELVVYDGATGVPLAVTPPEKSLDGQRIRLGTVQVEPLPGDLAAAFADAPSVARFDYIDLLTVAPAEVTVAPGGAWETTLVWRPRPAGYRDTYDAILELRRDDEVVATWRGPAGGAYPSGDWTPDVPVLERRRLTLPADVPAGTYDLTVRLVRAADELPIPARVGLLGRQQAHVPVATVTVRE